MTLQKFFAQWVVRPAVPALALGVALVLAPPLAAAAEGDPEPEFKFSTNSTFTTDYRFRGFTQTREGPAVQGGIDVTWRHFYAGLWSSTLDFGKIADASGRLREIASYEVDLYAGYKNKFRGVEYDVGFIYYAYPGAFGNPRDLDYVEIKGGLSAEVHKSLEAGLIVYYSPDYFGEVGSNWVFEGNLKRTFEQRGIVKPSISATLAYSAGEESKGGIDYWYWNAGASFVFAQYFELDLRYFDTIDVPSAIDCTSRCDGRAVARITFEY